MSKTFLSLIQIFLGQFPISHLSVREVPAPIYKVHFTRVKHGSPSS